MRVNSVKRVFKIRLYKKCLLRLWSGLVCLSHLGAEFSHHFVDLVVSDYAFAFTKVVKLLTIRIASIENVTEQVFVTSRLNSPCQSPQAAQIYFDTPPELVWAELQLLVPRGIAKFPYEAPFPSPTWIECAYDVTH